MGRRVAFVVAGLVAMLLSVVGASPAFALSNTPDQTWVTDTGGVSAVAQLGGTSYIAGGFTHVGPRTGPGVAINAATAQWDSAMPQASGAYPGAAPARGRPAPSAGHS